MIVRETYSDRDRIECPHCGSTIKDLSDYGEGAEVYKLEIGCGHCEGVVLLTRSFTVSYTATGEKA